MPHKTLITYTTWTGATREVAEAIGKVLAEDGRVVDVRPTKAEINVQDYDAVVVGTGVHAGQLPRPTIRFVKKNRAALGQVQVAYFLCSLTMNEDTAENRKTADDYLDKLRKVAPGVKPVSVGLFGGAVLTEGEDFEKMFIFTRKIAEAMGPDTEDGRDWATIRDWAAALRDQI